MSEVSKDFVLKSDTWFSDCMLQLFDLAAVNSLRLEHYVMYTYNTYGSRV